MENSLKSVIEMIDRVLAYVKRVINGEIEGNEKIGKYLLDTLSETSDSAGVDKGQLDTLFNSHLQASTHLRAHSLHIVSLNEPSIYRVPNNPGYSHGFLSGKSCTVASGGFDETGAGFVVATQSFGEANVRPCCIWVNDHSVPPLIQASHDRDGFESGQY